MTATSQSLLENDAQWNALAVSIYGVRKNLSVENLLNQLRVAHAQSVLIEEKYIDADFSAAFSLFYSTVFRMRTKLCKRYHFFRSDVTSIIDDNKALLSTQQLESESQNYLGYLVIRPLPHAPLGRAVIAAPEAPAGLIAEVLIYSEHYVHVLGATLKIRGVELTQQDSRIGACAQAAIWMAARHFHTRHGGPWISTNTITDAATKVTDQSLSKMLPTGSESLTIDNMLRALRSIDREPLVYIADLSKETTPNSLWKPTWHTVLPIDVIERYIDSGIPVILGLLPYEPGNVGHSVIVTGHVLKGFDNLFIPKAIPTNADLIKYFLIHDDQRGSNIRIALDRNVSDSETPYNIQDHLVYIIVPLPKKIFMTAETAEVIAWDHLRSYAEDWKDHKTRNAGRLGGSVALGDKCVSALSRNEVFSRTYLTYGWRYKERMIKNITSNDIKSMIFYQDLPKFVWVTEFGILGQINHVNIRERKIVSHAVQDATASRWWETCWIFHAPGMGIRRYHDPYRPHLKLKESVTPILDDIPYYPKVRGVTDYAGFPP